MGHNTRPPGKLSRLDIIEDPGSSIVGDGGYHKMI
jgi:hypothetical protein